jgi:hypothetical protein
MLAVHNFRHTEFRQKVTEVILEVLAQLPEDPRNIFIWNHYCGYQPPQIAKILRCSPLEVETTLTMINSILYERTRALLADPQPVAEKSLPGGVPPQEVECGCLASSSIEQNWVRYAQA